MGSSVSVLIAQHLSEQVAECIIKHLRRAGVIEQAEANAFVDDIFVSFTPSNDEEDLDKTVQQALSLTSEELKVTYKFCHVYRPVGKGTASVQSCPGDAKTTVSFGGRPTVSKLIDEEGKSIFTEVEALEVLGVVFQPATRSVSLKKEFQEKISSLLHDTDLTKMTARGLWKYCGTCFYAIYALGVCPSRFYWVFRALSNQAKRLVGATRWDERWDQQIKLSTEEMRGLLEMKEFILTFPTVLFEPSRIPEKYIFTDASDKALGVVIFVKGRIEVRSREWEDFEKDLPINSREVIAAGQGIEWAAPNQHEAVYLAVDNTSAFFDIVAGKSQEILANETVRYIRTMSQLRLAWIPSELMPADAASRQTTDDAIEEKIKAIIRYTTKFVALPRLY